MTVTIQQLETLEKSQKFKCTDERIFSNYLKARSHPSGVPIRVALSIRPSVRI
jgi:hypothetical protein